MTSRCHIHPNAELFIPPKFSPHGVARASRRAGTLMSFARLCANVGESTVTRLMGSVLC